jgi:hypothetical protein
MKAMSGYSPSLPGFQPILREGAASKSLHSTGISHQPKYFWRHVLEFNQIARFCCRRPCILDLAAFQMAQGKNNERFPELRFQGLRLRSNKAAQKSDGRNGGASCLLQIAVYGALPRQTATRGCEIDKPARRRLAVEMPSEVPCSHSEHLLKNEDDARAQEQRIADVSRNLEI